ncbi:MAG: discoidin domain-containing protein [Rhodopirellula sp.]|nr:discoidin domain-containing protein [Rhodopirellula sp.]
MNTTSLLLLALAACFAPAAEPPAAHNLVRDVPESAAIVTVDSSFTGYGPAVLSDGRRIAEGEEITQECGHRDRLGNGGNSWVSADTATEHWIRLDWPRPVTLNEVEMCWSSPEWQPRAFRVEVLRDGRWIAASPDNGWQAATDRQSIVPLPATETQSLRIVQAPGGGGSRSLMAAQEVSVFFRSDSPRAASGTQSLSPADVRRLQQPSLEANLAKLPCEGAALPLAWLAGGGEVEAIGLTDADGERSIPALALAECAGIRWPIAHVADGLAVVFSGDPPNPDALIPEVHNGEEWVAIAVALSAQRKAEELRLAYQFEPVATRAIRVRATAANLLSAVTEIEVSRYLPAGKDVWPDRLTGKGLRSEMLDPVRHREPSFEALALCALPMTPVRGLLGLKDAPHEIGIAWDGSAIGRETLRFSFGEEQLTLADCRDTVRRTLIDGRRPGMMVEGRIGPLAVRETAILAAAGQDTSQPALCIRIEVTNRSDTAVSSSVLAEAIGGKGEIRFRDGALVRGDDVLLLAQEAARSENDGRAICVDLALGPGERAHADFVHPQSPTTAGPAAEAYRGTTFDGAMAWFRSYWDEVLEQAATIEVPEPRINRMVKAVLAQLFINGDGDIMRYGSEPSVYSTQLYGIEESYAMFALAEHGFVGDAQRYMNATYLTPEFLKKVDVYKTYPDRHQQYRNGLQPHYAVDLYRLNRDAAWIRPHLPLLKQCAEWTIAERRKTMILDDGRKPLHWGLLPKWSYGGDIADVQCYALYANFSCWRGLHDTAWLLGELGEAEASARYAEEARQYRCDIDRAVEGNYQAEQKPPFLPLQLYATRPDEQMDYYQLFAGCLLDLCPFEKGSKHLRWIGDFLEDDNRMFCLLPRFRRDAGAGGLDALYAKGYLRGKLHEDAVREFLLGFYAFLAFNMDHETFISRETNLLYASDLHLRSSYRVPDISDPVPCSSAVALGWLRQMLVSEELAGEGEPSGNLLLLSGTPRAWLRDGQTIRLGNLPTHFGPVGLEVRSAAHSGRIEARVQPPERNPYQAIKLRLRHPEARPIQSVTVDGRPWSDVDPEGECIRLPRCTGPCRVVVFY